MKNDPVIFAIYEARRTWEELHSDLAKSGLGRFLEGEESIRDILLEIRESGIQVEEWRFAHEVLQPLLQKLQSTPNAILWNLTDGYEFYTGSNLPAFVQLSDIPHIGSGSYTQMLCQNKHHLKAVAESIGIPVAAGVNLNFNLKEPMAIPATFLPPYFVKPSRLDNSIGDQLSYPICSDVQTALKAATVLIQNGIHDVLVEEFLPGIEYSIIAANGGSWVMECSQIRYADKYFSSQLKDADAYTCEFVSNPLAQSMIDQTKRLAREIGLQDYFRADFRCGADGSPRFLEVNTNPFLASNAYDTLAKLHFKTRPQMFKSIITQSYARQRSASKKIRR